MGHQALTGWQEPTATKMHARACPRSVALWRLRVDRAVPVPGGHGAVARQVKSTQARKGRCGSCSGRARPSENRRVANCSRSHPPVHVGWKSCAIRMTHRSVSLALTAKIRLTTLRNCSRAVRPERQRTCRKSPRCAPPPFQCPAKSGRFREPPGRSQNDLRRVCRSKVHYVM